MLTFMCITFSNTNLLSLCVLCDEYFKLSIQFEPLIPLLRIPDINQSVIYHFENGEQPGFSARGNSLSFRSFPIAAIEFLYGKIFRAIWKSSHYIKGKEEKEKQATKWLGAGIISLL